VRSKQEDYNGISDNTDSEFLVELLAIQQNDENESIILGEQYNVLEIIENSILIGVIVHGRDSVANCLN
jgi:hypothetical protein